ncbi:unnamed protein product [Lactuca virosa]|uniref:J domain-containing protein n=1 Tax=Lactuca virosa TaxID=75947 RepID=A0AAU9NB93_9ASTR|nr:unnamed protein product [Lactuca virosa]
MAISASSSLFTFPNLHVNSHPPSKTTSTSIRFTRARISAAYATAERTSTATETSSSSGNGSPSSLYELLGVQIGADSGEVKAAYRRLARVLHPDVGSCDSSADEFMKVHSAYVTLSDPVKRAAYDRSLVQMRSSGSCMSRRWETDQCW